MKKGTLDQHNKNDEKNRTNFNKAKNDLLKEIEDVENKLINFNLIDP